MKNLPMRYVAIFDNNNGDIPVFNCFANRTSIISVARNELKIGVPVYLPEKSAEVLFFITEEKDDENDGWQEHRLIFTKADNSLVLKFLILEIKNEGEVMVWSLQSDDMESLVNDEGNKTLSAIYWDFKHLIKIS